MRKKIIGVVIAASVLLGAGTAYAATVVFNDVPSDHRSSADIDFAVDAGWFTGYPDGTFKPDQILTQTQLVKVIARSFHEDGITRADMATFMRGGYDAVEALAETVPEKTKSELARGSKGAWVHYEGHNVLGNFDYEGYELKANSGYSDYLYVRCAGADFEVYLAGSYLSDEGSYLDVTYRSLGGELIEEKWYSSRDVLWVPEPRKFVDYVARHPGALALEVVKYYGSAGSNDDQFHWDNTSGITAAVHSLGCF